ncbi:MAG: SPFH domain-containing protein [Candidatus Helarchaeota archaeon]
MDQNSLERWISETLVGIIKDLILKLNIIELYGERNIIINPVLDEGKKIFQHWGIELVNVELMGLRILEKYKRAIQTESELKVIDFEGEIEMRKIMWEKKHRINSAVIDLEVVKIDNQIEKLKIESKIMNLETERIK